MAPPEKNLTTRARPFRTPLMIAPAPEAASLGFHPATTLPEQCACAVASMSRLKLVPPSLHHPIQTPTSLAASRRRRQCFSAKDLEEISISGGGTVDGQAEYEWRSDDHERGF